MSEPEARKPTTSAGEPAGGAGKGAAHDAEPPAPDGGVPGRSGSPGRSAPRDGQFRTIFNSVTDGILIFDPSGRIIEANRVVHDRLGYTRDELLAMNVLQLDNSASAALFRERIDSVVRRGFATFEIEHVRRDGSILPLEVASRAIQFRGHLAILSVQRDITDRRHAEATEHDRNRFIQELLDAIPAPIAAKDPDGRIRYCNEAFLFASGQTREQVIGSTMKELGVADAAANEREDRAVMRTGEVRQSDKWFETPAGPKRMILTRSPLRRDDGSVSGTVTSAVDITERFEAEQAVRQSEARFRTLFEKAGDAIFIIDPSGHFVEVNSAAANSLGYTLSELRKMGVSDICLPEEVETLPTFMPMGFRPDGVSFETSHVRKDGSQFPVELAVTPMELDGRQVTLAIARDVSERKRTEAERLILEGQLRQAQKMEGIGRLASGIAHDFNNLLTAIGGFAGLAMAGLPDNDDRRRDIEQIQAAADRASALVRQLLAFSRANAKVEPKLVNIGEVLGRLERMLNRLISEDILVTIDATRCHACVLADPGQIEQVIVNLAVNARDAMRGGWRLGIEARDMEMDEDLAIASGGTAGPNVRIAVTDTGTGMDATTMEHLFEPFFTTKEPGAGTGLGLATVYGIVRNWGGGLRVQSEPGRGSVFEVYLPQSEGSADQPRPVAGGADRVNVGHGRRVLVVEDSEAVRHFAVRILERAGYEVAAAGEGARAVELGRAEHFDLVLTDLVLPSMQGDQVAAELRQANPQLRIVYMSGYGERLISEPSQRVVYLPKPFSAEDLLAAVERSLTDSKTGLV